MSKCDLSGKSLEALWAVAGRDASIESTGMYSRRAHKASSDFPETLRH